MDIDLIGKILSEWAGEEPLIKNVYMFGSRVRGDFSEESDIDVAIEFDLECFGNYDSGLAVWFFNSKQWQQVLQEKLPFIIHLEWYDPVETPTIRAALETSSRLVYQKSTRPTP